MEKQEESSGAVSPRQQTETIAGISSTNTPVESWGGPFDFLAPPLDPENLARLGQYRVVKLLGAGGMGLVFHAEDTQLLRPVALKVVRPELAKNAAVRERFLREARAMAALKCDYIVVIHQVGEINNLPFLAMEFLEGESLEQYFQKRQRPDVATVVRQGKEIALGLAAAHERGLIHRDIKPANCEGKRLLEFLRWVTREGQEYNTDLFYARLPPGLAERAEHTLKEVRMAN